MKIMLQILSLEPEPSSCALLKENTRHLPNVKVMCMGLWGRDGVQVKVEPPSEFFKLPHLCHKSRSQKH